MRTMIRGFVCAALVGCGSADVKYTEGGGDPEGTDGGKDEIDIAGMWMDSFGITNTITSESWTWEYPGYPDVHFMIAQYDNDEGVAILEDQAPNDMGEKAWARFDYMFLDDVPYYCETGTGLPDEDAALSTPPANHSDPGTGCNGTAWFEMTPI
jgi:hypothetical protein